MRILSTTIYVEFFKDINVFLMPLYIVAGSLRLLFNIFSLRLFWLLVNASEKTNVLVSSWFCRLYWKPDVFFVKKALKDSGLKNHEGLVNGYDPLEGSLYDYISDLKKLEERTEVLRFKQAEKEQILISKAQKAHSWKFSDYIPQKVYQFFDFFSLSESYLFSNGFLNFSAFVTLSLISYMCFENRAYIRSLFVNVREIASSVNTVTTTQSAAHAAASEAVNAAVPVTNNVQGQIDTLVNASVANRLDIEVLKNSVAELTTVNNGLKEQVKALHTSVDSLSPIVKTLTDVLIGEDASVAEVGGKRG